MTLDKIVSISGRPGLYELKNQTRTGFLVKSLLDGKTKPIQMTHNVSVLKDISIYTEYDEVNLREVFQTMYDKADGAQTISHKADKKELESYFEEIVPEYDRERVYTSDMKKVVQWYNLLVDNGMTQFAVSDEEE